MPKSKRRKRSTTVSLAVLQTEVAKALFDESQAPALGGILSGDVKEGLRRFGYYRQGYRGKVRQQIEFSFEAVLSSLPKNTREKWITEFLVKCPSTSEILFDVGPDFVRFVAGHPISRKFRFLPDLARLEWQIMLIFSLPRAQKSLDRLAIGESVRLMESSWPVARIWRNRHRRIAKVAKLKNKQHVSIRASSKGAVVQRISQREYEFIRCSLEDNRKV